MAERLTYYILQMEESEVEEFIQALQGVKSVLKLCSECFSPADGDLCAICSNVSRDHATICVVRNLGAVNAIERTKKYNGMYHILEKIISPLEGITPEKKRINKLLDRLNNGVKEIILATDTDTEGELTANYIADLIKTKDIKITRLGYGMPVGGTLEYADEITLTRSLEGRKQI